MKKLCDLSTRNLMLASYIAAALAFSSCGKAISDAQEFGPNTAPEITSFSATNSDGSAIDATKIACGRVYQLTVNASDMENNKLSYSFTSGFGTFRNFARSANGCTVQFVAGVLKAGDEVKVSVNVTDPRKAVTGKSIDLGTGKTGPSISVVPSRPKVKSNGDITLKVSSNCAGRFQIVPRAAGSAQGSAPSWNASLLEMNYPDKSASVTALLTGPASGTVGTAQFATASSYGNNTSYWVWVVFRDALDQTDAAALELGVDNEAPAISSNSTTASSGSISTNPAIDITFNEDVNEASLASAALSVTPTTASSAATGAASYKAGSYVESTQTATFMVTGLTRNTEYTATLTNVKDLAGNVMTGGANSFVFVTTPSASVNYSGNNPTSGSAPISVNMLNGQTVTVANSGTLAKEGCTFGGWNTRADGTGTNYDAGTGQFTMGTESVTLYAKWMCTVTFSKNLGSAGAGDFTDVVYNSTVSHDDPTQNGCTFLGWYTAATGGTKWNFAIDRVTHNMTLYAHWGFTVTVNPNNGSANYTETVNTGNVPATPSCPGFTFAGWYSDPQLTTPVTAVTEPMPLYAKWYYAFWNDSWSASMTDDNAGCDVTKTVTTDSTGKKITLVYANNRPDTGGTGTISQKWTFTAIAQKTGTVRFTWEYNGAHAFYSPNAKLSYFVNQVSTELGSYSHGPGATGTFSIASSAVCTFEVNEGDTYGFIVEGGNGDSNHNLSGTVVITSE